MKLDPIPVNTPLMDGNEAAYLKECVDTCWISSEGPFVKRLEQDFSAHLDMRHGVAVTNGTAALEAAVAALGIGPGDEVILPSFTIVSCAQAVTKAGATPVVVDSEQDTWNMDTKAAIRAITPRTKAIMPVHIYGLPVDMDPLLDAAAEHGIAIIEDSAQAIGTRYKDRLCGSMGTVSTFSFYPNKLVTTGEGGFVATNDEDTAERLRSLRNLCFQPDARFVHHELGWNLRMTNLQAALGVAQLERLDAHVAMKKEIGRRYFDALSDLDCIELQAPATDYAENHWWVFGLVLKENAPLDAKQLAARLAEQKIGTRPFFWPMHEQPVFRGMGLFEGVELPVAQRLARRGLYLPSGLGLTPSQQDRVVETVRSLLKG